MPLRLKLLFDKLASLITLCHTARKEIQIQSLKSYKIYSALCFDSTFKLSQGAHFVHEMIEFLLHFVIYLLLAEVVHAPGHLPGEAEDVLPAHLELRDQTLVFSILMRIIF